MNITEKDFYLTRPSAMGFRGWSLLIPALSSSLGFFCFGVLAFSFTELADLPHGLRTALVLTGAFALAFGAEFGTLANVTEIYRKSAKLRGWDLAAMIVSVAATVGAFVLAFATLLGVKATWGQAAQLYGPIVLGLLAALDSYGGFVEFGLYLNCYDERMKDWSAQFDSFRQRMLAARWQDEHNEAQGGVSGAQAAPQAAQAEVQATPQAGTEAQVRAFYIENPLGSQTQAAKEAGVSRQRVGQMLKAWEQAGEIRRNGKGVEIIAPAG